MSGIVDRTEDDLKRFGRDLENDFSRAASSTSRFVGNRIKNPSLIKSDIEDLGRGIKKTSIDVYDDVYDVGDKVVRYTKKAINDPRIISNDVINITDEILNDVITDIQMRFMIYTGILYFILSHKSFRSAADSIFKSIPIVGKLYIFPHLMNTAIFLSLLYVVKMSLDGYVKTGLIDLEKLIPAIVTRPTAPKGPVIRPTPNPPAPEPSPDPGPIPPIIPIIPKCCSKNGGMIKNEICSFHNSDTCETNRICKLKMPVDGKCP